MSSDCLTFLGGKHRTEVLAACMQPLHTRLRSLRLQPPPPPRWPTYGWATSAPMCCNPSSLQGVPENPVVSLNTLRTASHGPQALCHPVSTPSQHKSSGW